MADSAERPAALVTGAATRLGLAFARSLAERGYDIALHYNRSADDADRAASLIRSQGVACQTFQRDLGGDDPGVLVDEVVARFPALSALINCASAYAPGTIAETTPALLKEQFAVNFFAPFLLTRGFAEHVTRGCVINIVDNKIAFQQNHYAAYLLSKKSLAELTRLAAVEFAPKLRVNAIAPGVVLPGEQRSDDYIAWRLEAIPAARQGRVEELIMALDYLLTNEFVTGQVLFVDGGEGLNQRGRHAQDYAGGGGA